jgi:hypothetical protein
MAPSIRMMETTGGSSSMTKRDEPPLRVGLLRASSVPVACADPVLSSLPF